MSTLERLGTAKKIRIDAENTTVVQGGGKKDAIEGRAAQIRAEIDTTDSEYDREKLQERLAKLAGGVAQINVGAATETEMKERKDLIDDALHATRAAVEEGVVPGGGVALLRCGKSLDKLDAGRGRSPRRAAGARASSRCRCGRLPTTPAWTVGRRQQRPQVEATRTTATTP